MVRVMNVTMTRMLPFALIASNTFMMCRECSDREKPRGKWAETDGGIVFRAECFEPADKCHRGCYVRDASLACTRCCMDQDYVCDTGHKADFDSCEGSR